MANIQVHDSPVHGNICRPAINGSPRSICLTLGKRNIWESVSYSGTLKKSMCRNNTQKRDAKPVLQPWPFVSIHQSWVNSQSTRKEPLHYHEGVCTILESTPKLVGVHLQLQEALESFAPLVLAFSLHPRFIDASKESQSWNSLYSVSDCIYSLWNQCTSQACPFVKNRSFGIDFGQASAGVLSCLSQMKPVGHRILEPSQPKELVRFIGRSPTTTRT